MSADESERLLAELKKARNPQLITFVIVSLLVASRRSELLGARWLDWDPDRLVLTRPRKGHTGPQEIRIPDKAALALELLRGKVVDMRYRHKYKEADLERIFAGLTISGLRSGWEQACKRAEIIDLHLHDVRGETLSRLVDAGLDLKELMLISGHKTIEMLLRYIRKQGAELRAKVNAAQVSWPEFDVIEADPAQ